MTCKILKFSNDHNFEEILLKITKLNREIYQNLSIFIIGHEKFELLMKNRMLKKARLDVDILKNYLINFGPDRQLFLQITTINESEPKFYHKNENFTQFFEIKCEEFVEKIDIDLLNLMLSSKQSNVKKDVCNKFFKILYKPRTFIKIINNKSDIQDSQSATPNHKIKSKFESNLPSKEAHQPLNFDNTKSIKVDGNEKIESISQERMLVDVRNRQFVVITGNADSGKSFVLKNSVNELLDKHPDKFVMFVDLKQSLKDFKAQETKLEFSAFMLKNPQIKHKIPSKNLQKTLQKSF
ncbi:hypothetical protein ACKWTF_015384 [Chironomus riparius]